MQANRGRRVLLAAVVTLAGVTGPGASWADAATRTTKKAAVATGATRADYVRAANAACKELNSDLMRRATALGLTDAIADGSPESEAVKKRIAPLVVTYLTSIAARLEAIPTPVTDKALVASMVASLRAGAGRIKADYKALDDPRLVMEANRVSSVLGMGACGQS